MTDAARSDYSWSAPNRRFIDSGLYLPSIRSEGIDTIAEHYRIFEDFVLSLE